MRETDEQWTNIVNCQVSAIDRREDKEQTVKQLMGEITGICTHLS